VHPCFDFNQTYGCVCWFNEVVSAGFGLFALFVLVV
jgi:hypothetical protein